jgi:hypothetical protein
MAKAKRGGAADKNAYSAYKATDRCAKNKARKMKIHLASHPADEVAASAKPGGHTRKAPNNKGGWITGRVFASLSSYLLIDKDDKVAAVSKSRAVQKRLAQHMALDKATRNELSYTRMKKK